MAFGAGSIQAGGTVNQVAALSTIKQAGNSHSRGLIVFRAAVFGIFGEIRLPAEFELQQIQLSLSEAQLELK
ncbi:hypothetical protein [Paenibacillus sp. BAC0078]